MLAEQRQRTERDEQRPSGQRSCRLSTIRPASVMRTGSTRSESSARFCQPAIGARPASGERGGVSGQFRKEMTIQASAALLFLLYDAMTMTMPHKEKGWETNLLYEFAYEQKVGNARVCVQQAAVERERNKKKKRRE